jgi:glutathione S-transferase
MNGLVQPLANLGVLQEVEARFGKDARTPWATHWDTKGMSQFENHLKATAGKYCVGDRITLADIFLIPQVYRAARFEIDPKQWPVLWAIHERLQKEEFVQKAHCNN